MRGEVGFAEQMLRASYEIERIAASRHYHVMQIKKHSHTFDFIEVEERLVSLKSLNVSAYKEFKDMVSAWDKLKSPFSKNSKWLTSEIVDFEDSLKPFGLYCIERLEDHFEHLKALLLLERRFLYNENKTTFEIYLLKMDEYRNSIKALKSLVGSFFFSSLFSFQQSITQDIDYAPAARKRVELIIKHHYSEISKGKAEALEYHLEFFKTIERFIIKERRKITYLYHK